MPTPTPVLSRNTCLVKYDMIYMSNLLSNMSKDDNFDLIYFKLNVNISKKKSLDLACELRVLRSGVILALFVGLIRRLHA